MDEEKTRESVAVSLENSLHDTQQKSGRELRMRTALAGELLSLTCSDGRVHGGTPRCVLGFGGRYLKRRSAVEAVPSHRYPKDSMGQGLVEAPK